MGWVAALCFLLKACFLHVCVQLSEKMADQLTDIVTDAVLAIRKDDEPIDLYMVSASHSAADRAHIRQLWLL